ncbi:MAG: D-2-hydroxyacid dehydrogenase [Verrucomicrobiota bacterium]|nr:D-2-hydroxyacid dehydrogenase [Verrucomicrobiota bacterium]
MKITVLDAATMGFDATAWSPLLTLGEVTLRDLTPYDAASIIAAGNGADVLVTNKVPITAEVLSALPQVKLVAVLATGYNTIDTAAARSHGVGVANVPAYSTEAVAQHTIALIMALSNTVAQHDASIKHGDWCRSKVFSYWLTPVRDLAGLTLGLVGFGEIGRRVGAIGNALGMRIMAQTRTPRNPPAWKGFQWADIATIFREADIVSLHCPATPENRAFVNNELLATMKPDAYLINTARGVLIDEAALANALNHDHIAGAAVDVLSTEPPKADNPLLNAKHCVITPHIAWSSPNSRTRLLNETVANIIAYSRGERRNRVE